MAELRLSTLKDVDGWGFTYESIESQLNSNDFDRVVLPINSYGGAVFDGMAIRNLLKYETPAKVEARIIGYAMSSGTLISSGADVVKIPAAGYYMIHNPWTVAAGDENEMKERGDFLKMIKGPMVTAYKEKTGLSKSMISDMMDAETWLEASKAKELGFVDEVLNKPMNSIPDPSIIEKYKNVPDSVWSQVDPIKTYSLGGNSIKPEVKEETKDQNNYQMNFIEKIGNLFNKTLKDEDQAIGFLQEIKQKAENIGSDISESVEARLKAFATSDELQNKLESTRAEIDESIVEITGQLKASIESVQKEIEEYKNALKEKEIELNKAKENLAKAVAGEKGIDPSMDVNKQVIDEATAKLIKQEF